MSQDSLQAFLDSQLIDCENQLPLLCCGGGSVDYKMSLDESRVLLNVAIPVGGSGMDDVED